MNTKNIRFKIIMFISSYSPLYLMLFILYFDFFEKWFRKIPKIFSFESLKVFFINFNGSIFLSILIFLSFLLCIYFSIKSIFLLKCGKGVKRVVFNHFERPSDVVISYIMTYIIPLLSGNLDSKPLIFVNFILFLLIGYLYIRLNLIYLNPLWAIFGFITYRADTEKIIISDMSYEELKKRQQTGIIGYYILNDIFVAKKEENKHT